MFKYSLLPIFLTFLGASLVLFSGARVEVAAQSSFPATLSCIPEAPSRMSPSGNSFSMVAGARTMFTCTAKTVASGKTYTALLLSSQTLDTETTLDSDLTLTDTATTTPVFPPIFQSGTYRHTFSLIDTATQQPLAEELVLLGTLKGIEQPPIKTVSIEQETPLWEAPFILSMSLEFPEGTDFEKEVYFLHAALQGIRDKECAVLVENTPIVGKEMKLDLAIPQKEECTNVVNVTLRDMTGFVVDERTVTVKFPEKSLEQGSDRNANASEQSSTKRTMIVMWGSIAALVVLLAYLWWRYRRV